MWSTPLATRINSPISLFLRYFLIRLVSLFGRPNAWIRAQRYSNESYRRTFPFLPPGDVVIVTGCSAGRVKRIPQMSDLSPPNLEPSQMRFNTNNLFHTHLSFRRHSVWICFRMGPSLQLTPEWMCRSCILLFWNQMERHQRRITFKCIGPGRRRLSYIAES